MLRKLASALLGLLLASSPASASATKEQSSEPCFWWLVGVVTIFYEDGGIEQTLYYEWRCDDELRRILSVADEVVDETDEPSPARLIKVQQYS
jgi:hypothetical protein